MNSLGVYFGTNSIGLAEVSKKKLVNSVVIPQASMFAGEIGRASCRERVSSPV